MAYRPDVDGLRAIAVLSVLFYHAHLGFPGGFVGVDVFFVISGYLITGLLVKALSTGSFSYLTFWERRVRRLLPALLVVTIFVALTAPILLLPEDLKDLRGSLTAQPLLLANVYFWRKVKGGYFGDEPEIRPLLHTWSLGLEEQFYVAFPLILALWMKRRALARHTPKFLLVAFATSLLLCVLLTPIRGALSFFTLPTRAWELLMGGLLVFAPRVSHGRIQREVLAWVGLALIAYPLFFFYSEISFPGYAALAPCLGTALLILANNSEKVTWLGCALSQPAMVRLGQISYSLYLWHWPVVAYCGYLGLLSSLPTRIAVVLLSCLLGYASWRWIETPFRNRQILGSGRSMLGLFLFYAISSIGLGQLYWFAQGFPENWHANVRPQEFRSCTHTADPMSNEARATPIGSSEQEEYDFLLWGDSHAMSIAPLLHQLGQDYQIRGLQLTTPSTAPLVRWGHELAVWDKSPDYKERWKQLALKTITRNRIKLVFLCAYWSSYDRPEFADDLNETIRELSSRNVRVVFVGDFPSQPKVNSRNLRIASRWPQVRPSPSDRAAHDKENAAIYQALASQSDTPNFSVLDPSQLVLAWKSLTSNHHPLYIDSHHLSDQGSLLLRPLFEPIFRVLAQHP